MLLLVSLSTVTPFNLLNSQNELQGSFRFDPYIDVFLALESNQFLNVETTLFVLVVLVKDFVLDKLGVLDFVKELFTGEFGSIFISVVCNKESVLIRVLQVI